MKVTVELFTPLQLGKERPSIFAFEEILHFLEENLDCKIEFSHNLDKILYDPMFTVKLTKEINEENSLLGRRRPSTIDAGGDIPNPVETPTLDTTDSPDRAPRKTKRTTK